MKIGDIWINYKRPVLIRKGGCFERYPFNLNIIKNLDEITFNSKIKVIEGDNEINNLSVYSKIDFLEKNQ